MNEFLLLDPPSFNFLSLDLYFWLPMSSYKCLAYDNNITQKFDFSDPYVVEQSGSHLNGKKLISK